MAKNANTFNFDRVFGGDRGAKLLVNDDGRDVVRGGQGRDVYYIDPKDRTINREVTRDDQGAEGTITVAADVGTAATRLEIQG